MLANESPTNESMKIMEIDQLQELWKTYDRNLDNQAKVNETLLTTVSIAKVRSLMGTLRFTAIFEWGVYLLFLMVMIPFALRHAGSMKFFLPAMVLIVYAVMDMYSNTRRLYLTYSLSYSAPIARIQKQVQELHIRSVREHKWLYFQIPAFGIPLLIVMARGLMGIDLYQFPEVLAYIIAGCILIAPPVAWLVGKFPDEGLEKARSFLEEIARFEKED